MADENTRKPGDEQGHEDLEVKDEDAEKVGGGIKHRDGGENTTDRKSPGRTESS